MPQPELEQEQANPTPEQENVASEDIVVVYSEEKDDTSVIWRWKRVDTEGDVVSESDEEYSSDNYALAAGANENPGLMAHVPETEARELDLQEA